MTLCVNILYIKNLMILLPFLYLVDNNKIISSGTQLAYSFKLRILIGQAVTDEWTLNHRSPINKITGIGSDT